MRSSFTGQNGIAPPNTPGPDDDFRYFFPQQTPTDTDAIDWSDVAIIASGVLYAALGTPAGAGNAPPPPGSFENGVFRTPGPHVGSAGLVRRRSGSPTNEVETVTLSGNLMAPGTFQLTFRGASTTLLPVTANAFQVQGALDGLTTIGGFLPGSVNVTEANNVFTITFGGSLGNTNQPLIMAVGQQGTMATSAIVTNGGGVDTRSANEFPASPDTGVIKIALIRSLPPWLIWPILPIRSMRRLQISQATCCTSRQARHPEQRRRPAVGCLAT